MQVYLGFLAFFIVITFSFNFSLPGGYSPFFVSGLSTNYQHGPLEGRNAKSTILSEHEAQELRIYNTDSFDGFAFFPINS